MQGRTWATRRSHRPGPRPLADVWGLRGRRSSWCPRRRESAPATYGSSSSCLSRSAQGTHGRRQAERQGPTRPQRRGDPCGCDRSCVAHGWIWPAPLSVWASMWSLALFPRRSLRRALLQRRVTLWGAGCAVHAGCDGWSAQDVAQVLLRVGQHLADRNVASQLLAERGDASVRDAARHDHLGPGQVTVAVEREPVHRDALTHPDADRADLAVGPQLIGVDPHSAAALDASGGDPEVGTDPDHHLLEPAHMRDDV